MTDPTSNPTPHRQSVRARALCGVAVVVTGAAAVTGGLVWHQHTGTDAGQGPRTPAVTGFSSSPDTTAAPALDGTDNTAPRTSTPAAPTTPRRASGTSTQHGAGGVSSTASTATGTRPATSAAAKAPAAKGAGTVVPVRANPDDATGADTKAAYSGSPDAAGTGSLPAAQQAYANQKPDVKPSSLPANRVYIPSVGIYSSIIPEKTTAKGLNIPSQLNRVAWATSTPSIAATSGTTVLAGHVSFGISHDTPVPAAFANLYRAKAGAVIYTTDTHGGVHAWRVSAKRTQHKNTTWYWHTTGARHLILITCTGPWVGGSHRDNLIVTATPVPVSGSTR